MSFPKIPGYLFDHNLGRNNYSRSQIFHLIGNTKYAFNDDKINKSRKINCDGYTPYDFNGQKGPKWIVYDKKVLSFDGYWLEGLLEFPDEQFRSRECKVYYYLEDDTIQVVEPRIKNSQLVQGTVVNRRRILKQPVENLCYYTLDDMDIGAVLCLGGQTIKLTGCDKFTENFLRRLGRELKYPIEKPSRNMVEHMKKELAQQKPKSIHIKQDYLTKFLNFNKHVLKFYCFWNNEDAVNDPRSMTLLYFLEDDTIEIQENLSKNCGRTFHLFLRRQRLPKYPNQLKSGLSNVPSQLSDPGYLNVIKSANNCRVTHKIKDSLTAQIVPSIPFYKDEDLSIGQNINVYGRLFLICDCDEFTKEYYRVKYGINQTNSIDIQQYFDSNVYVDRTIPPYNGWGSEEDSILNCINPIQPHEMPTDYRHFFSMKRSFDNLLKLNFLGRIEIDPGRYTCFKAKYEAGRLFIISYGLDDNNFHIKEMTQEKKDGLFNKFLIRGKIQKPKKQWANQFIPEYFTEKDLYIGAFILVKGLKLKLLLSDSYTLNYMEKNVHNFPYSSISNIISKLHEPLQSHRSELEQFLNELDSSQSGYIDYDQFMKLNSLFLSDHINLHETVTLGRHFTDRTYNQLSEFHQNNAQLSPDIMKARIRKQLRFINYDDFESLKETWFRYGDPSGCNILVKLKARNLLKSLKFPLKQDLIEDLLLLSRESESSNLINLCKLLDVIEWQKLHPNYWNIISRYQDCEKSMNIKHKIKEAEENLQKTFQIGPIKYRQLMDSILNEPIKSSSKTIQSKYSKENIDIITKPRNFKESN